jgi:proteic killer suppression protein
MIKTFQHKGLKIFFETGITKGIRADHAKRLRLVLAALDTATGPVELNLPGYRLHPLKGQLT